MANGFFSELNNKGGDNGKKNHYSAFFKFKLCVCFFTLSFQFLLSSDDYELKECLQLYYNNEYYKAELCFQLKYEADSLRSYRFKNDENLKLILRNIVGSLIAECKKRIRENKACSEDYTNLAKYYIKWKWLFDKKMTLNLEKTKKLLDEAIQLNPEYSKIYLYYGELFLLKDTSKAIEYLTKSFKLESDNPSTIKSLILAVQFSGSDRNFKELILELEGLNSKLLQLSPSSIDGYEALKNVSFQHRDFKGCIKYGKKIINLKPNDFLGYFNLGFFYRIIENYNLAIKYFEIGLKLHNIREKYDSYVLPYDEVHIWLAEAFEKIGEIKKALKIYEKFKMKFPNGKPFLPQSALDWRIHKIKSSIKDKEL